MIFKSLLLSNGKFLHDGIKCRVQDEGHNSSPKSSLAAKTFAALSGSCRLTEDQVGYTGPEGVEGGNQVLSSFMALAK